MKKIALLTLAACILGGTTAMSMESAEETQTEKMASRFCTEECLRELRCKSYAPQQ